MTIAKTLCRRLLPASALLSLTGCSKTILLDAPGDIARQQGDLIVVSTLLMLLIIVPVIALTLFFAWRYRASNEKATYKPDWDHSTQLELLIWSAPLLIIIALGAITWVTTHTLDPFRPLNRIAKGKPIPAGTEPLVVEVAALNGQWLFVYPEQGIATTNELALPVDHPVQFRLTSTNVMHAFYVPALAGMIYAMPGMETQLHAVINQPGEWEGFASNYSGPTFNAMRFKFHGVAQDGFDAWVAKAKAGTALDRARFGELDAPLNAAHPYADQNVKPLPPQHFGSIDPTLFHDIVNLCVAPGQPCMDQLMMHDSQRAKAAATGHSTAEPAAMDREHGAIGHAAMEGSAAMPEGHAEPAATEAHAH